MLGEVVPGGPAARAGLLVGDEIMVMDGTPVRSFLEFRDYVRARPGQEIVLVVRRGGSDLTVSVTAASEVEGKQTVGRLNINAGRRQRALSTGNAYAHAGRAAERALAYSVAKAWQLTAMQAKFFGRMLTGDVSLEEHLAVSSASPRRPAIPRTRGILSFLMLMVLLSLSLGFLNLLPIPILDGGQIVFQLVEWAKGRALSDRTLPRRAAGRALAAGAAHGRGAVQRLVELELRKNKFSRGLT